MKVLFIIIFLFLFTACAAKQEVFDPVAKFTEAEKYMQEESFENARKAYQEIQEKATDRSYDADIMLRIADTYFGEEKYEEALVEYQAFLNFHPVNKNASYAQYQIAMCSFRQLPTIDRDPSITRSALKEFARLVQKYPTSPYADQARRNMAVCRERLAAYELYVARFYHKKGSSAAAAARAEGLMKDYPDALIEKDALLLVGRAYAQLGKRDQALQALETLVKKYPAMRGDAADLLKELRTK
ncbi:MAG: hypothetical protein A2X56_13470 [Nitrospirae bacterium GWC2_57_13]|jgi:outer membrane protein assembly factor BamD|nr:MAG: hypothetical protein A2072_04650 [Nitrospirae bacterium GWC1_57_7]OGW29381.1 MAG: hypothetical protein A2X56_13470 [Nitrospirae bacterium GWC2_57_13]OGW41229.1 MAG: hypothetical protein A2X57_12030 [Nitrospirae bacterium GWD2_57_8]HAR46867.1 hypothetical protein [Nitrospiraceae bacterium]HAS53460.1 hypothetical protein [Nitrospiraceae bacterium]